MRTVLPFRERLRARGSRCGPGITLTGIAYSADAAVNLIGNDPDAAAELLRELRAGAGDAIAEIRRIRR
jgi:two-component system, NarL family, sensor kinase